MNISSNVSAFGMSSINSLYSSQKAVTSSSVSTNTSAGVSYTSNNVDTVEISQEGLQKSEEMKGKQPPPPSSGGKSEEMKGKQPPPPPSGGKSDMSVTEDTTSTDATEETSELDLLD